MISSTSRTPNIDLHSHSTESDGVLSPRAAVEAAARDGVTVLALTDHDTLTGIPEARRAAAESGIELVAGVEVSCAWGRESVHLLGLFVDPEDRALTALFDEVSERRRRRIAETCSQLTAAGVPLRFEEVAAMSTGRSLGRPHVADALVHKGAVRDRAEAFDRYLGDGKAGHVRYGWKIGVDEAAKMLHAAGGISSVAHPKYLRDQSALPSLLRETGVQALEAYHVEQDGDEREHYLSVADSLGLMVSGGSDFHEPKHGRRFGSELPPERYEELLLAAGRR
ncbi:MAG: PHP domain-containing protein [Acidobacteriota bacterium]|nr:PHP domain-containing protein [Acidobacteriota bacterium]MDE3260963.1 PHP domain-containing protein [Acidobacteriota bacterium]